MGKNNEGAGEVRSNKGVSGEPVRGGLAGMARRRMERPSDALLVVLSVLLLVTLGLASLYGMKYGNVDDSVMPGRVTITHNDADVLTLDIASMEDVTVDFGGFVIHGKLRLEGADTQSVLYTLYDRTFESGRDPENTALLIRVPRSGLQGDLAGPWMVYYTLTDVGAKRSMWTVLDADGSGYYGADTSTNPMTQQYEQLKARSSKVAWSRDGSHIVIAKS